MRLSEATVAIHGLGLMGGSLGLAMEGKCKRRIGIVRRLETADLALQLGAVDNTTLDFSAGVSAADVVVLATPVRQIVRDVEEAGRHMPPGSLLIDLGSTKGAVVEAMDRLPGHVSAVGGHPMCGKEVGGLEHADAGLFADKVFVLTATARTDEASLALSRELVEAAGARPVLMDPAQHDRAVAYVSHLPYLLAATLVRTKKEAATCDPLLDRLAASGFRDTSRLAASEVPMMRDILLTNRQAVEDALASFERQLGEVRELLDDQARLEEWMLDAQRERRAMFV
ncbi:MAG: prephenate dehydrogenase/arogenate dehydrogenase family protein [Chloroflexota bacterium]|nr:prephenate dehydrogenase/arogenate dehydrogenase family protein [Chloroflexota bacterium]MDQ5866600.1 prephenate dehydrogenase/arogenate dehydrogenase family protein [Chloroflexota bacterium]